MPVPTRRLALVALALSVPMLFVPLGLVAALVVFDGVLIALAVLDAARAPRPASLSVERDLPAVVALGTEAEVAWRVRNPSSRPVVVALADELAPSLG
ncbi:MAG: DUF58 domain-containing protein, partial [Actinomycetota bacterium]|nr:DUF58 domain-containing protein [Actinomycetota bacterium]